MKIDVKINSILNLEPMVMSLIKDGYSVTTTPVYGRDIGKHWPDDDKIQHYIVSFDNKSESSNEED